MAYQVIARRYRPKTFSEVIGQKHITETIAKSIAKSSPAHAYLFSGPHGVGKTSLARIIAKALNCVQGPTDTPCGECPSCKQINEGNPMDVIEIDGASNRGIDNIREIIENVRISPAQSRYKVYIIDEVHQITNEAFNALLKTLEEPPKHVIFILATTEIDKVLPTIKSRCQQFTFKRLGIEDVEKVLINILEKEKIEYENEAVFLIAKNSRGSVRDSETILEKMIAYTGEDKKITVEKVLEVVGSNNFALIQRLFNAMMKTDKNEYFSITKEIKENGIDVKSFTQNLLEYLRVCVMMKAGVSDSKVLEIPDSEREEIYPFVKYFNERNIENIMEYVLNMDYKIRTAYDPFMIFELRGLKLLDASSLINASDVLREIPNSIPAQATSTQTIKNSNSADHASIRNEKDKNGKANNTSIPNADGNDKKVQFFNKVTNAVKEKNMRTYSLISRGRPVGKEGATLIIALPSGILELVEKDKRTKDIIQESIKSVTSNPSVKFNYVSEEDYMKEEDKDAAEKLKSMLNAKKIGEETGANENES